MAIVSFLVHLMGATMLLLYAVRMVRTGIERAFGPQFNRIVTQKSGRFKSAVSGVGLAVVLQSSAAVVLLVAGFAGTGLMIFSSGLAMSIGADLGSALLIQILSFQMDWLVPVLLALGGSFFMNSSRRGLKQAGRIIIGIAFILISLRFLRETMDPIRDTAFLPAIAYYLESDFVAAFIAGAGIAFVMHSSVAVILMVVTLVAVGALPELAGVSMVLGANLGSALIPVWLSRTMPPAARRIPMANLIIRGSAALVAVWVVNNTATLLQLTNIAPAQTLINVHLAFNCILLLAIPFGRFMEKPLLALIPDLPNANQGLMLERQHRSVLSDHSLTTPQLALSALKREILRMVQLVESMCEPVMDIYETGNKEQSKSLVAIDLHVNSALDGVRQFMAKLPSDAMTREDRQLAQALAEYAIAVESAGDTVVKRLIPRALEKIETGVQFSTEGQRELLDMHNKLLSNIGLAANVLVSDDLGSARMLLEEKTRMTRMERESRKKHLHRLGDGGLISFESSNIHLETLLAYKDLNSHIASVAYPILHRAGQLLETRLVERVK